MSNITKQSKMKSVLAAAVIAAVASPAALAQVTVYGRAHITVDILDDGNDSGTNVSSNSSRLGFRANTEIREGLTGIMQIEQEVRYENGSGSFASRDSFAGLRGDFGQVRLGFFDTPLKVLRGNVDLFGDQIGDARNMTRVRDTYTGGDYDFETRFRNGIHYRSPEMNNLTFDLHYSSNTDAGATIDNDNDAYSTALSYRTSDTYMAMAYERKNDTGSDSLRFGAGQSFGDFRINAMISLVTVKGSTMGANQDVDTYGIGASYQLNPNTTLKGQYYWNKADGNEMDAQMIALGVDYRLSSAFRLLFAFAQTSNDDNVRYAMSKGGHGAQVTPAPGETARGFSVGVRYDF